MVSRSVDDRLQQSGNTEVAVVDRYRPNVDGNVQRQIQNLMHWEQEDVYVIRRALQETVDGMECVTGERCCHLPGMMRLVYGAVDKSVVKPPMNPVDETVGEQNEGHCRRGKT